MGEGEAEEKKPEKPSLDSYFSGGKELPKFGGEALAAPRPPLPAARGVGHSHASYLPTAIQPDEAPLDWRRYVTPKIPTSSSLEVFDLKLEAEPEAPNAHQDRTDSATRANYWRAYGTEAQALERQGSNIAGDYAAFMAAQKNPELRALGFLMHAGWTGDASSLAEQQHVAPNLTMNALFRGDGSLNTSTDDDSAISTAGARLTAHGDAKQSHDDLVAADSGLSSSVELLKSAGHELDAALQSVHAAEHNSEAVELRQQVAEDREALEELQQRTEGRKGALEFAAGGIVKFSVLEAKEVGDIVESLGVMASYAIGRFNDRALNELEQRLRSHSKKLDSEEQQTAQAERKSAEAKQLAAVHSFRAARQNVVKAIQARQKAYNAAGQASAASSGGGARSRSRIAGAMAAIPAVEFLYGLARDIAEKLAIRAVKYSDAAASGFHMAVYAHRPQATDMVAALDQVEGVKMYFDGVAEHWAHRLVSLQRVQTLLGGNRPTEATSNPPDEAKSEKTH